MEPPQTPREAEHGFTDAADIDRVPKAAYRDETGRRYEAPEAPAMRFDSIEVYREGRSAPVAPSADMGLLDVLVCTDATLEATGVLILDGTPIAAGDGRYQFELSPGTHRLEVQGLDAASAEFTVAAGEKVHFTTGQSVAVRHQVDFRTHLYRVRDDTDLVPVLSERAANRSGLGCLTALVGTALIVVVGFTAQFAENDILELAAVLAAFVGLAALIGGTIAALRTSMGLHKRAKANRVAVERTKPATGTLAGPAVAFPSAYDAKEWCAGREVRGPLLVFDLFLYRVTRHADGTASYSGDGEALAFANADSVRAWIDGEKVPADWAAWHYPLKPGEHRCRVEYDEAAVEFTFEVADVADLSVIHVPVRVFRIWDDRTQSSADLPPQITHREVKRARSIANKTLSGRTDSNNWVPPRLWLG